MWAGKVEWSRVSRQGGVVECESAPLVGEGGRSSGEGYIRLENKVHQKSVFVRFVSHMVWLFPTPETC